MTDRKIKTTLLGYPRIGENRELKKATESYWKGEISLETLLQIGKDIRKNNWKKQVDAGIDVVPTNDFTFYDQTLDMSCLLGNIPERFDNTDATVSLDTLFLVARGNSKNKKAFASEMTKWFDTNYHYIVPEFNENTTFSLSTTKVFDEVQEALDLGYTPRPVLLGPVSYLKLGKEQHSQPDFNKYSLIDALLGVYKEILEKLESQGINEVQFDEGILCTDLTQEEKLLLKKAYEELTKNSAIRIFLATYFGELRDNKDTALNLPIHTLHIDTTRGEKEIEDIIASLPESKSLSLGIVDGRNIWKNDYSKSLKIIQKSLDHLGESRVILSSSCSLQHVPVTLKNEANLDSEIRSWLSYADEKMKEVSEISTIASTGNKDLLISNQTSIESRRNSKRIHKNNVKKRYESIQESDFNRQSLFLTRQKKQEEKLKLPLFPTTTIGSFPQTKEVRTKRLQNKRGEITDQDYDAYLKEETKKCVEYQEKIGIDMLVHGEFERNDMVEYFGENLDGFLFTSNGWVQSYGSRYVKPPVIYGDVERLKPMTVYWSQYAQSITTKPMKGMLTGPITILQWSFVRDDQTRKETTFQIALAIRDEVIDLESAGIAAIQIDEPAIREGLPLRQSDWSDYLEWAVNSFRLSAAGVKDETQIHTHMCYSEFNDIIEALARMDADVISIETSRSNMELLDAFVNFKYPNEIGPGVYDIHSPRVPTEDEMVQLLEKANEVLPTRNIWVNPDCGLKTRDWEEVGPALEKMVMSAKALRKKVEVTATV
jgi:5-methyltetrahydropteroyltriglutamate--homocysteine methyltransferase